MGTKEAEVTKKAEAVYEGTPEGTETNAKTRRRGGHEEQKYSPKRSRGSMKSRGGHRSK